MADETQLDMDLDALDALYKKAQIARIEQDTIRLTAANMLRTKEMVRKGEADEAIASVLRVVLDRLGKSIDQLPGELVGLTAGQIRTKLDAWNDSLCSGIVAAIDEHEANNAV